MQVNRELAPSLASEPNSAAPRLSDPLCEAMVAKASAYLLSGKLKGAEPPEHFREIFNRLCDNWPREGRIILGAGLMAAGFTVDVDPIKVEPPDVDPEAVIDADIFSKNWYLAAPTLIDMGAEAVILGREGFDHKIHKLAYSKFG